MAATLKKDGEYALVLKTNIRKGHSMQQEKIFNQTQILKIADVLVFVALEQEN